MIIEMLIANPAAGKTDAIIEHLLETNEFAVVASPSKTLSNQSYKKFIDNGGRAVLIDSSQRLAQKTVGAALDDAARQKIPVIFITHSALSLLDARKFSSYHLIVDEVPSLVEFKEYKLKSNYDYLAQFCEDTDDIKGLQPLTVKSSCKDVLETKLKDGANGLDVIDEGLTELYGALLDDRITVMLKHTKGDRSNGSSVFYLDDTKVNGWRHFRKVTIAAANLKDTFTGKVLEHYRDCKFIESPLVSKLRFREYKNTNRVKIHVMTDLYRWSKYKSNNNGAFDRMVEYIKDRCGTNFLYTVNKSREASTQGIGVRVPYGAHGLNCYMDHTNVAVLFSYNLREWEREVLQEMAVAAGLPKNEFTQARHVSDYLEPAFQLCLRCNLRHHDSTKEINLFVPDLCLAEYIQRYLPDAQIITECMIDTEVKKSPKKMTYQDHYRMTKDERRRFSAWSFRLRKKGVSFIMGDPKSDLMVQGWVNEQRDKYKG